ncbi:O-methyltransferase [Agrilactobacillus fermenti]|uniref:O-methyltransferase n=1 Tax=Agrilactobacillus fermenti TaxID=2586909 RepID=UPI003A5BC528
MLNEMMHRPIIDKAVLTFLREQQQPLKGPLGDFEKQVREAGVPVIPPETVNFFKVLLKIMRPKRILEVGTAVGFSTTLMALNTPETTKITTIDRFDVMLTQARQTFKKFALEERVQLLAGDAADLLPKLTATYDWIFLDSAKAKYISFLPDCLRLLNTHGVLLIDDVMQGGTVLKPDSEIKHKNRSIHRNLNRLFTRVFEDDTLSSSILPLGDGLLMITKN